MWLQPNMALGHRIAGTHSAVVGDSSVPWTGSNTGGKSHCSAGPASDHAAGYCPSRAIPSTVRWSFHGPFLRNRKPSISECSQQSLMAVPIGSILAGTLRISTSLCENQLPDIETKWLLCLWRSSALARWVPNHYHLCQGASAMGHWVPVGAPGSTCRGGRASLKWVVILGG